MTTGLQIAKRVVPQSVRARLREYYRAYVFSGAIRRFLRNPKASIGKDSEVLKDLVYGWGNRGWSALDEYLTGCVEHAMTCDGPILECGSGLTTILTGAIAQRTAKTVYSLEHQPQWAARTRKILDRYGITAARVYDAPLRNYGSFSWYEVPKRVPKGIALVICDGPPGDTPGGRYGLVPVMREYLKPGAVVLLDDARRDHEHEIAERWAQEFGKRYEMIGSLKPYARFAI